jgi:glucose/arabinose dehydrogenase
MDPDGSNREVFAEGVRNTVGFTWHPGTGVMWFTDNGRDRMGDDVPSCELNRAPAAGIHFGFPYCHGGNVPDPDFSAGRSCDEFAAPAIRLGAHVAPLGLKFYDGQMFPEEYRGQLFVAEHGSWNRSEPVGYRITLVRFENGQAVGRETFADGWLQDGESWGRPVDVLVLADDSLLVSDDKAGRIYRIVYSGDSQVSPS